MTAPRKLPPERRVYYARVTMRLTVRHRCFGPDALRLIYHKHSFMAWRRAVDIPTPVRV